MREQERPKFREQPGVQERRRARRVVALFVLALVIIGAAASFAWWERQQALRLSGDGSIIRAPAGPYKVRPPEPGGMRVEGQGSTAFATSEGAEAGGQIDRSAEPELPLAQRPGATPAPANSGAAQAVQAPVGGVRP